MTNETKMYTEADMQQAHMAGQSDAGVDPSYSNAQSYTHELRTPKPVFNEDQIVINKASGVPYMVFGEEDFKHHKYRALTQAEAGNHLMERKPAMELRKAVTSVMGLTSTRRSNKIGYTLNEALKAFDAATGEGE